jgi:hypothetical protein
MLDAAIARSQSATGSTMPAHVFQHQDSGMVLVATSWFMQQQGISAGSRNSAAADTVSNEISQQNDMGLLPRALSEYSVWSTATKSGTKLAASAALAELPRSSAKLENLKRRQQVSVDLSILVYSWTSAHVITGNSERYCVAFLQDWPQRNCLVDMK